MSIVELRVELPSYSHSFLIQVPLSYTILEVKGEITRSCPGAPRADGQRIIWRGRVLRDEEKVEDIWKVCPRISSLLAVSGSNIAHSVLGGLTRDTPCRESVGMDRRPSSSNLSGHALLTASTPCIVLLLRIATWAIRTDPTVIARYPAYPPRPI